MQRERLFLQDCGLESAGSHLTGMRALETKLNKSDGFEVKSSQRKNLNQEHVKVNFHSHLKLFLSKRMKVECKDRVDRSPVWGNLHLEVRS